MTLGPQFIGTYQAPLTHQEHARLYSESGDKDAMILLIRGLTSAKLGGRELA